MTRAGEREDSDFLLHLDRVTLRRGGRMLLEDFTMFVNAGERVVVTGPNGSGKSSLLRLAAGLLPPERGRVERTDGVALANDDAALDRDLRLMAALEFWVGSDSNRLPEAVAALKLSDLLPIPVAMLSAGQIKRATLARTAASSARLWLLDEPTNALDAAGHDDLQRLIDGHVAAGGAVLAASHQTLPGAWREVTLGR